MKITSAALTIKSPRISQPRNSVWTWEHLENNFSRPSQDYQEIIVNTRPIASHQLVILRRMFVLELGQLNVKILFNVLKVNSVKANNVLLSPQWEVLVLKLTSAVLEQCAQGFAHLCSQSRMDMKPLN